MKVLLIIVLMLGTADAEGWRIWPTEGNFSSPKPCSSRKIRRALNLLVNKDATPYNVFGLWLRIDGDDAVLSSQGTADKTYKTDRGYTAVWNVARKQSLVITVKRPYGHVRRPIMIISLIIEADEVKRDQVVCFERWSGPAYEEE